MKYFLSWFFITLTALIFWSVLVIWSTENGWFHSAKAPDENPEHFMAWSKGEIKNGFKGNLSYILIENGEESYTYNQSMDDSIEIDSVFQVSSLGKWVAAFGVMTLVQSGEIELDKPISNYLTRWQLPESKFDNSAVTVRRLLSHTAGLTDGLGHSGFAPGEEVQKLEEHLTQASDADEGVSGKVKVGVLPGSEFIYSGGGYNLLQLLVEEVSKVPFEQFMKKSVFEPLGMNNSSYFVEYSDPKLAKQYDGQGRVAIHYRYTSLAATGLYSTARDLSIFVNAHFPGSNGEQAGRGVLSEDILKIMRQPHASKLGADIWGLGTILYAPLEDGGYIIGHDGQASPAINSSARLNPKTGDAIIIIESGSKTFASKIAGEWTFWQSGKIDFTIFPVDQMLNTLIYGVIFILFVSILLAWHIRKNRITKLHD